MYVYVLTWITIFSLLQGQFRNDSFNGQGTIKHSSGMIYEGLWINGKPANIASRLVITNETPVVVEQGSYFEINVECQNDLGTATHGMPMILLSLLKNVELI